MTELPVPGDPATKNVWGEQINAWLVENVVNAGGGAVLYGHGAPPNGSPLQPLDGVSDPFRWANNAPQWVGPAFEVTVAPGATLNLESAYKPANAEAVSVYVVDAQTYADAVSWENPTGLLSHPTNGVTSSLTVGDSTTYTAEEGGTGVAFLIQNEASYGGPTTVPDATLDIADYLGAGFTLGDVYEWPDETLGADGQSYIDLDTLNWYGPRTAGTWSVLGSLNPPV